MNRDLILEAAKARGNRAESLGQKHPIKKKIDNHRRLDRLARLNHIRQKMKDRLLVVDAEIRELNAD